MTSDHFSRSVVGQNGIFLGGLRPVNNKPDIFNHYQRAITRQETDSGQQQKQRN
jgi:hypothetical protein